MAVEFAPYGITVNGVNGGLIDSDSLAFFYGQEGMPDMQQVVDQIPLQRPGTVEDMANAIEFLISPQAGYITGQTIVVDGGLTVSAPPRYSEVSGPMTLSERPTRS
jgi:NAD(P)-dependent dehydrogenase (short-subunit alcohol dehydrogenase family)